VALARIGVGAIRRRVFGLRSARVELGGRGVFLDADLDTAIGLHVYRHGWCDAAAGALDRLLDRGDVVVDGGANIGAFSLVAASVVGPEGAVHAVEGAPATVALLRRSVLANPGYAICVHEVALADAEGVLDFTTFEAGSGYSSFAPAAEGTATRVPATTLDALTAPLPRVDLVKLDLEGAELRALRGAGRLLAERRPTLLLELEPSHLARQGGSLAEVEALLTAAGYTAFAIVRQRGEIEFAAMKSPWHRPAGEPNVVAVPLERRTRLTGVS
jgi:FkbM family methyltransferase